MSEMHDDNNSMVVDSPTPLTNVPEQPKLSLDDLRVGFVVGLSKDNNFVFNILGKDPGLLELLGLQQLAAEKIKQLFNNNNLQGDALVVEVAKMVKTVDDRLSLLMDKLFPRKPDNTL